MSDPASRPGNEMETTLASIWAEALGLERIGVEQNYFDLGASSLMVAEVHSRLQQHLQQEISLVDLFQFPTSSRAVYPSVRCDLCARRIGSRQPSSRGPTARRSPMSNSSIAIVGMAGRFPGAPNIEAFWRNLRDGVEAIRTLNDAELRAAGVSQEELENPEYVRAAAILDGLELFDASFFGFSPRDASIMDPQHRHFLECAWEAVENAGYTAEGFPGSIGVFAGSGMSSYLIHNLLRNRKLVNSAGLFLLRQTGNDKDVLATRVSYQLNLHGPSVNVQTACSTSLVAVHLACQSLLNHECDMALGRRRHD